jgi:hypothetical protein
MTRELELRDQEVLRTLCRVQFLTTREIGGAFFASARVARRRLHKLSEWDYIKPHTKGIPPRSCYSAWRLTTRGVEAVETAFPNERIPDGLVERLSEQSLYNLEHREAIARIYLDLITKGYPSEAEGTPHATCRKRAAELRARAELIEWRPDGDVTLAYVIGKKRHQVIPDATVVSRQRKVRIFIEVDRSTKALSRIKENLKTYRSTWTAFTSRATRTSSHRGSSTLRDRSSAVRASDA